VVLQEQSVVQDQQVLRVLLAQQVLLEVQVLKAYRVQQVCLEVQALLVQMALAVAQDPKVQLVYKEVLDYKAVQDLVPLAQQAK
jgi:hypothetical protein